MSYDASAKTLLCPFCGSERLEKTPDRPLLAPERVVPFKVSRAGAEAELHAWLGAGFWRPNDLRKTAALVAMRAVYVPYWVFFARAHTYFTADTDQLPLGSSGDWRPVFGEHQDEYAGLLVGGSTALAPAETAAISPFDLRDAVPPDQVDLDNVTVEQFSIGRKYARPLVRDGLEAAEIAACSGLVDGTCRNVKVNVRVEDLTSEPVLLPAWIVAYRYRNGVYRFLLNGQTGQPAGQAPVSYLKIAAVIGLIAAAAFLALVLFAR
jgi:hypothetical protein